MAEKKRKVTAGAAIEQPAKKSRKSLDSVPARKPKASDVDEPTPSTDPVVDETVAASKPKKSRKRAADFLSDAEGIDTSAAVEAQPTEIVPEKASKKAKKAPTSSISGKAEKAKKSAKQSLTADGANGVMEQNGVETVDTMAANGVAAGSMMEEATQTADQELADEFGSGEEDEEIDQAGALLAGFDSDNDDPAEDKNLDLTKTAPNPNYKKTSKKLRQAAANGSDGPGTVYVGRIPHGFYELPMREYFSQFGTITKLRLSRNKRTGASKHFAFIEFASEEVAKIVAETMDNYLMFGHILKCKYAPQESLHPDVWKGANRRYRRIPHNKLEKQKIEAPKTQEQWEKKNKKEQNRRNKKAEAMKRIGYEFKMPKLAQPADALEQKRLEQAQVDAAAVTEEVQEPTGAIDPPPNVPLDTVALEIAKKGKKPKATKAKTVESTTAEDVKEPTGAIVPPPNVPKDALALEKTKKGKKSKDTKTLEPVKPLTEENLDAKNDVSADPTSEDKAVKKSRSRKRTSAASATSDKGAYDNLSSVAVNEPANGSAENATVADTVAPASVAPIEPAVELTSVLASQGTADAELKKRTRSRKKENKTESQAATAAVETQIDAIAPAAVKAGKDEKKQEKKDKSLKGILKKAKGSKA